MSEEKKEPAEAKEYDWDKLAEEGGEITPDMVASYEAGLSDDDLMGMVDAEEIGIEWEDERPNTITAEKLEQWVKGEITWAQVEGIPDEAALSALRKGVELKDGRTRPAQAQQDAPRGCVWGAGGWRIPNGAQLCGAGLIKSANFEISKVFQAP